MLLADFLPDDFLGGAGDLGKFFLAGDLALSAAVEPFVTLRRVRRVDLPLSNSAFPERVLVLDSSSALAGALVVRREAQW